jgi:hypothetical protein
MKVGHVTSLALSTRDAPGDLDEEIHGQVAGVDTEAVGVDELEDKQAMVSEIYESYNDLQW